MSTIVGKNIHREQYHKRHAFLVPAMLAAAMIFGLFPVKEINASVTHGLDSNSRLEVKAASVANGVATVLFGTWADRGDEHFSTPCSRYYYSVRYQPDGSASAPRPEASGVCGSYLTDAGILDSGEVVLMTNGEMQYWRDNKLLKAVDLVTLPATRGLMVATSMEVNQYDYSPSGNVLLSLSASGYMTRDLKDAAGMVVSLRPDGSLRWEFSMRKEAFATRYPQSWIGNDGSAVLHRIIDSMSGMHLSAEEQIVHLDAAGKETIHSLTRPEDMSQFENLKPEDMQKFYEYQRNADPESLKNISARARSGGGFDVLYHRKGGGKNRSGHWLRRLNQAGVIELEHHLGEYISEYGLDQWVDFYVENNELILLSRVMATQSQVPPGTRRWMQNAVSWIPLDTGVPRVSRKMPLDMRYLEAAMNSGDEGRQYLAGSPNTEPHSLQNLNGTPLVIGSGYVERKWALRLERATQTLPAFTEAIDTKREIAAKKEASGRRKAAREQTKKNMNADMAAAVGMTPEEYAALSRKEQKEILVRKGDLNAMMASAMKQSQGMQQAAAAEHAAASTGSPPTLTAEQKAQMANIPGMSPEQSAQLQAAMAQMQAMSGGAMTLPQTQAMQTQQVKVIGDPLQVDAAGRAFVEFENPAGTETRLRIFDRESGKDLLTKQYADGTVYEYLDFSGFGVPMSQVGISILDGQGKVLTQMTPVQDTARVIR